MPQTNAAPSEIGTRLEKLRFITDELWIAANLAGSATHSDMARMLARHVAVRTADFIAHARQLRNCLPSSAASTKVKNTLNAFDAEFQENLALSRHKLGAHVQDIDFGQGIDIWLSIDSSKIDYFASGARETWDLLGTMTVAGHQPFTSPAVLANPSVASALTYLAKPVALQATYGTDPLSLARANTSSIFNGRPVHLRAGQLALLRRWMRAERELLALFQPHPAIARILKSRMITDIVSFRDCLITRQVAANAPQAMEGLDVLITSGGKVPTAIQEFAESSREDTTIEPIRDLRNRIGGHLEIDPQVKMQTLLAELDGFDLDTALRHYSSLEAVFIATCRRTDFLATHLMDGMEVGTTLMHQAEATPFDAARPDVFAGPPPTLTFSQAEMQAQLDRWISGHSHFRREVVEYFRDAFARAPLAETRTRVEDLGPGKRFHQLEIKTSHLFMRDALIAADPHYEQQLLLLASQCPGYRDALSEVLVEYHQASDRPPSAALLKALGTLSPWWLDDSRTIIKEAIKSSEETDRLLARVVLLRVFLREEGVKRMNGAPGHVTWPMVTAKILADVPTVQELATFIALASTFLAKDTGLFVNTFQVEYRALADAALAAAKKRLAGTLDAKREAELITLLYRGHIGQAVLHIVTTLPKGHARPTKQALLHAFGLGYVETGTSDYEGTAVAEILLLLGSPLAALDVLDRLRRNAPGDLEPALRTVEVLAGIGELATEAQVLAAQIREQFTLNLAIEARLSKAEAQFGAR